MNKTRATRSCTKNGVSSININKDEVDRIGSLPDEVLTHILSFLITKEAVQTCVLSKRWKNTWAAVPILDIKQKDFSEFGDDDCSGDRKEALRMFAARFERFMTGFLNNRAPTNLERVCCVRHIYSFEPDASVGWLDRVALLRPHLIKIFITSDTSNSLDMPDIVFSCASLQNLVMEFCTNKRPIIKPMSIYLPSLKVLQLVGVDLLYDFPQMLFMGCPSLESLYLCFCGLYFSSISSIKLKKLGIAGCDQFEEIKISCPDLVSLFIASCNEKRSFGISLKDMTSLVNATVHLRAPPWYDDDYVTVLNLFGGLLNVTNLELRLNYSKLKGQLEKAILNCIKFNNLKKLCIGVWNMSYDIYLIAYFLKHSPNLKELTLELFLKPGDTQLEPRQEVLGDVSFQHEYLETVEIKCVIKSEWASVLIKTLDKYVKKIENIIIS